MDTVNHISHNSLNSQYNIEDKWVEPIREEAYYGLSGKIVKVIEPYSEADPVALLAHFIAYFGNIIGNKPHFKYESDYHALKIYPVMVGRTSKSRKGVAQGRINHIYKTIFPNWVEDCIVSGLSSGEGLVWNVRDPINKEGEVIDFGVEDKRLLVMETEFASVLRRMQQEGNTLSVLIRQAWDGNKLRTLTKKSPAQATGAHITIIGHITKEELIRYLNRTEMANGFGNRILWLCVKRSKLLPDGGIIPETSLQPLMKHLEETVDFASKVGELRRNENANDIWHQVYPVLTEDKPGIVGALTGRAEANTMRIACLYALLDKSKFIIPEHLRAALALWRYSETSVLHIFGDSLGDPIADAILTELKANSGGLDRTAISNIFGRHKKTIEISNALSLLDKCGLAKSYHKSTGGRIREIWVAK